MIRLVSLGLLLTATAFAARPAITFEELPNPARAANAGATSLAGGPSGGVWLVWQEGTSGAATWRFSHFDGARGNWSAAQQIAGGKGWVTNPADTPSIAGGEQGQAVAVWSAQGPLGAEEGKRGRVRSDAGHRVWVSRTTDFGRTWSAASELTREGEGVEMVSLAVLADGRVLAAWLDDRGRKRGGNARQLYSRIIGQDGPDLLIDPSVCDCCPPALLAFPDGTALLAYRGRTTAEVRDIRITRLRGGTWEPARPLHADNWRIEACPVSGPQIAQEAGRVAAAWFTGADDNPRVFATFSPDAGRRFLLPLQISEARPTGRVAVALLHDGAILVVWVDVSGTLWLRRVTPDYVASDPLRLTDAKEGRVHGTPRIALVRDYTGGRVPAQALVSCSFEGGSAARTLLVTIPEGELIELEQNCECASSPEQLRGNPLRGTIAELKLDAATLRLKHFEVPGVLAEGVRDFRVDPAALPKSAQPGRQFYGRIERRDGTWWLFDLRLIASPPK